MSTLFLTFFAKNNGKSRKNKRIKKILHKCVIVAYFLYQMVHHLVFNFFGAFWGIGRRTSLHTSCYSAFLETKTGGRQLFLSQQLLPPDAVFLKKQFERGTTADFQNFLPVFLCVLPDWSDENSQKHPSASRPFCCGSNDTSESRKSANLSNTQSYPSWYR